MALTNEQYDALMREYNLKQARNNQIVARRTEELYSKIPALSELDEEMSKVSVSTIELILNGKDRNEASEACKRELAKIKAKRDALIKSAGYDVNYLEPSYDCKDCKDTGYIDGKRCHCFEQASINLIYKQINLSNVLKKENFDSYNIELYSPDYYENGCDKSARELAELAYNKAKSFVKDFESKGGNILLVGQTGCGKTFLTNCITKALNDKGVPSIYLTATELFRIFEEQTFKKKVESDTLVEQILNSPLLIIDDLGTELPNTFTITRLFQCLNERLIKERSTIISTNLSLVQMRDVYSERITSRVFSNYDILRLIGEDIRIKKMLNNK